jgi:hypothetical protein
MSAGLAKIESMFDSRRDAAAVVDRMCAAMRAENRAAGERLAAIGELDVLRLGECGERETWSTDTWDAISAEVPAASLSACSNTSAACATLCAAFASSRIILVYSAIWPVPDSRGGQHRPRPGTGIHPPGIDFRWQYREIHCCTTS